MRNEIRMKDARDEDGTGFLTIEEAFMSKHSGEQLGWTEINRTWYYKGVAQSIHITCDVVKEVQIQQFTKTRCTWTKKQIRNGISNCLKDQNYNYTVITRKEKKC